MSEAPGQVSGPVLAQRQAPGLLAGAARTIDVLSILGGGLSAALIVAMAFSVFYEIVMRSVFNAPTTWVLEYSTYFLIAAGFVGAAYVAKLNQHVNVDVIVCRMSDRTRMSLEVLTLAWSIGFSVIFIFSSVHMVSQSIEQHRLSISILETPMYLTELPVAVGACLLFLQYVKQLVQRVAGLGSAAKAAPVRSFVTPFDSPAVVLPAVLGLLILSVILFNLGGSAQVTGLILMMLTLFASGTPIFLVLCVLGSFGLFCLLGGTMQSQLQVALQAYKGLDSFTLEAIPLFIMGASVFATTRLTDGLFDITKAWLSFLPANLLMATMICCALFAAITGSSVACAATIGLVTLPPMLAAKYEKELCLGAVAAGGTLGILIPPSLSFILIGEITQTSVGQLFIAGIIPGIFLTLVFLSYIYFVTRNKPLYQPTTSYTWKERIRLFKGGGPVLLAPVVILGGIYTGIFTPTEAAAVSVIYGLFLGVVTRRIRVDNFITTLVESTRTAVMILMIIAGAMILGSVVTILRIPQNFSDLIVGSGIPAWAVIVMMNILLLVLGMFLECASITLITVPIFYPTIQALGFDALWFAVIFTINMELALITPPVGLNLYIIQGITKQKMEAVVRGVIPFIILMSLALIVVALVTPMSTWLPAKMLGK